MCVGVKKEKRGKGAEKTCTLTIMMSARHSTSTRDATWNILVRVCRGKHFSGNVNLRMVCMIDIIETERNGKFISVKGLLFPFTNCPWTSYVFLLLLLFCRQQQQSKGNHVENKTFLSDVIIEDDKRRKSTVSGIISVGNNTKYADGNLQPTCFISYYNGNQNINKIQA